MALVAYDSSGEESSGEDTADSEQNIGPKLLKGENSLKAAKSDFSFVNKESKPVRDKSRDTQERISVEESPDSVLQWQEETKPRKSIFSFLPPPTRKETRDIEISEESDDITVKQTREESSKLDKKSISEKGIIKYEHNEHKRSGKLNLPKPRRIMECEKQKVKITVPNLLNDDSDSDEEESRITKKQKFRKGHSGLLGCLPQPKFSSTTTKAADPKSNERKPSRLYVPYTLNKKKDQAAKNAKKPTDKGSDTDSDDEGSSDNFFSFGSNTRNSKEDIKSSAEASVNSKDDELYKNEIFVFNSKNNNNQTVSAPIVERNIMEISKTITKDNKRNKEDVKGAIALGVKVTESSKMFSMDGQSKEIKPEWNEFTSVTGPYECSVTGPYGPNNPGLYNQSAEAGNDSMTYPYKTYNSDTYSGTISGKYGGISSSDSSTGYSGTFHSAYTSNWGNGSYDQGNVMNNYRIHGQKTYLNPEPDSQHNQFNTQTSGYSEQKECIDADQLRRLQGKRERRVQEIDIIDIHGEQMQCDPSTILKNISEEKTYMPKRSKSELPSSQQKRKHQITYLAFQAKERENELRKSWAANLQTKRQTQQKYGF